MFNDLLELIEENKRKNQYQLKRSAAATALPN